MAIKRSDDMVLVGYFLARHGVRNAKGKVDPPDRLGTSSWKRAYAMFYASLGGGRTLGAFANSLKNARDGFDGHLDSGRVGWRQEGSQREPVPLSTAGTRVDRKWGRASESELWTAVRSFVDLGVVDIPVSVIADLEAEFDPGAGSATVRTEGGRKMVVTTRVERDPRLRANALRIHGTACQACGFDFGEVYGAWGKDYVEAHHVVPLAESKGQVETNAETDICVLCANCHRMVHRKKGQALSLEELRNKVNHQALREWATRHSTDN